VRATPGSDQHDRHHGAWRIGRLAGVPIGLHPLWLVIVGLLTWSLGEVWFPEAAPGIRPEAAYALGLLSALTLFAGILLHELGHAVVARRRGVEVEEIDLWLLGGVARLKGEPGRPQDELLFALAGPAVTLLLGAGFATARLLAGGAPDWLRAFLDYQLQVTIAILLLNLLPAFPLDGGRALRSALWWRSGDRRRSTELAATAGRLFGLAMITLGVLAFGSGLVGGLWFAVIGGFLFVAAGAEAQASAFTALFAGMRVEDLMSRPAVTIPAYLSVADAITACVLPALFSAYPVEDDEGLAVGIVRLDALRAVPPAERGRRTVLAITDRDRELLVAPTMAISELLSVPAFARVGRAVVVGAGATVAGIISVTDLERMRTLRSLQPAAVRTPGLSRRDRVPSPGPFP
jgi:Zn-dependent protease/CBS domain-containing protein